MPLRSWGRYRWKERASAPPGRCSSMMSQWPRIAVERAAANQPRCLFVGSRFPLICVGHVQRALLELQFDNSKLWTIIQSNQPPTARHPLPQRADAMASRQLALNFQRSLRSRAAINSVKASKASPLTRGLATPVSYGSKTESTTLSNGFTV